MPKPTASTQLKAISAALLLFSGQALAEYAFVTAQVKRVLVVGGGTYGGCMAQLSVSPSSLLPGCSDSWVSFSCSGDFTDRVRAYQMLDSAKLALATGKQVYVVFRDDMTHNGYCFADRIDVKQ